MRSRLVFSGARFARQVVTLIACLFAFEVAQAQAAQLSELHTLAAPESGVPFEHDFQVSAAGSYQIAVKDFGALLTPAAPLASLKVGITRGTELIGTVFVGAGTFQFTAPATGTYTVRVVGKPGTGVGSGPFGVVIATAPANSVIATFSDTLAPAAPLLPANLRVLDDSFTVDSAGSYQIELTDLNLPQSLDTLTLLVAEETAPAPVVTLPDNSSGAPLYSKAVSLQAGVKYRILAVGRASDTANGGLYDVTVRSAAASAPAVFNRTLAVGLVKSLGTTVLGAADYTLSVKDLAVPVALVGQAAALVLNGHAVARQDSAGDRVFTATAGPHQVFAFAAPAATPSAGSYAIAVRPQTGDAVFSDAEAIATPGGAVSAFTYSYFAGVGAGGAMRARLTDFLFPAPLGNLSMALVQDSALLGTPLTSAGQLDITATDKPLSILVFAQHAPSGGLFGLDITANGGTGPLFETTQGVGTLFVSRKISVPSADNYDLAVADVKFPDPFAALTVIVTRGTERLLTVLGPDTKEFAATPGNYFVNFIAQPGGTDQSGTYSLSVVPSPVPTVSLTSNIATISAGGGADLTWTSQRADSCTASGGWTGTKNPQGTERSGPINAATTFTLTCTGPGGSTAQSVQVDVERPPQESKDSGGGGGRVDILLLLGLAALVFTSCARDLRSWRTNPVRLRRGAPDRKINSQLSA
ncbi:MAG: hypothetical protein ABI885_03130 [Gammaproteobacteria bacterium]